MPPTTVMPLVNTSPPAPRSSVLFHRDEEIRATRATGWHAHDFWQLEWARDGAWDMTTDVGDVRLRKGDLIVLPPGVGHAFHYPGNGERFLSVKFHVEKPPATPSRALSVSRTGFFRAWRVCLDALLAEEPAPRLVQATLAGLLDALLIRLLPCDEGPARPPACVRRALDHIAANPGRALTVAETARVAGVAPGYLAGVFRRATGITVKQAIDRERTEAAKALLRYSELTVGQIAGQLGFGDIFSFSRFFKKHTGRSPRGFQATEIVNGRGG